MTYTYDRPTVAGKGILPGTKLLMDAIAKAFPNYPLGSYNRRCVVQCGSPVPVGAGTCGNGHGISHHAESTAVDVMTTDPLVHHAFVEWALTVGKMWQVQEIVTGYPPLSTGIKGPGRWQVGQGWKPYSGSSHRDHIHLSQTYDAASWTSPPQLPPPSPEDDDIMYRFYTPQGFYDVLAVGPGVPFHVPSPSSAQEMVDHLMVAGGRPGQPYAELTQEITVELWSAMAGQAPASPR